MSSTIVHRGSCVFPGCSHSNDDPEQSDLCGHHFSELLTRITEKKRQNPNFFLGKGPHVIARSILRFERLTFLGVDEQVAKKIVASSRLPLDFEEKLIGTFPHDPNLVRHIKYKVMPEETFNGVIRTHEVYSSLFFTFFDEPDDTVTLYRFTTKGKHLAGPLEKMVPKNIFAMTEILASRSNLPFKEAWDCVGFELDFYHYDRPPI